MFYLFDEFLKNIIWFDFLGTNVVRLNHQAHVTQADISATNGVVHIINNVLIPRRYHHSDIFGRK